MPAPDLEPHCGSWVLSQDGETVCETFSRKIADIAADSGKFTVETAAVYLGRLNRNIREGKPS